jgi:hypothetical protein
MLISHGLVSSADGSSDVLRQEELNLLVCEVTELVTEDIVDADMICISSRNPVVVSMLLQLHQQRRGFGGAGG